MYTFKNRNNKASNKINYYVSFYPSNITIEHSREDLERLIPYHTLDYLKLSDFKIKFHKVIRITATR